MMAHWIIKVSMMAIRSVRSVLSKLSSSGGGGRLSPSDVRDGSLPLPTSEGPLLLLCKLRRMRPEVLLSSGNVGERKRNSPDAHPIDLPTLACSSLLPMLTKAIGEMHGQAAFKALQNVPTQRLYLPEGAAFADYKIDRDEWLELCMPK